jgi:hypothetical protein
LPEAICDTSPLHYLYQLELLHVLPALTEGVIVPPAVVDELATGRALGINLPDVGELDWISVRHPISAAALPLVTDLAACRSENVTPKSPAFQSRNGMQSLNLGSESGSNGTLSDSAISSPTGC